MFWWWRWLLGSQLFGVFVGFEEIFQDADQTCHANNE